MEVMKRSTRKIEGDNASESGLLWRDEELKLLNDYEMALHGVREETVKGRG